MALDATRLAQAMKAALLQACGSKAIDNPCMDEACLAMAEAIVDEIKANAEVTVPTGSSAGTYSVS